MSSERTNANGECTINGVSEGTHTLTASKTGYSTLNKKINVDGSELNVNIELHKDGGQGFDVHMTVVDEQDQPIPGATVELDGVPRTTGSAGGCNFQNITKGTHTLTASKTGYSTVNKKITVDGSQLDFPIILEKEEAGTKNITFQLKDENGNNISEYNGTNLELLDSDKPVSALYTGLINENGQATINDIKFGTYTVSLPAIPDEYRGLKTAVSVEKNTSENVDLFVQWNLSDITFKVIDDGTGEVISGATVRFDNLTGVTDDRGLCTFKDLPRGNYKLAVSHKFYHGVQGEISVRRTTTDETRLKKTKHSVNIHVHDGDVNIQNASVELNNTTKTTDVNGNCSFTDIVAGEYSVKVSAKGYEPKTYTVEFYHEHTTADIVLEVNTTNVTIELKESGGATRVKDAIVNLNNENKITDEKGKCTFEKVQYGEHPLRIFKEGYKTIITNINVYKDMSVWAEKLKAGDSITLTAKNTPIYEGESLDITGQLNAGSMSSSSVMQFQIGTTKKGEPIDSNTKKAVHKYTATNAGLIPVTAQYNGDIDSNVLYIHDGDLPRTNVTIKPIDEVTKEPLHYATSWLINQQGWEIAGDYQKVGNEADTVTIENVICGKYSLKVHHGQHKEKIQPLVVKEGMGVVTVELTPNSNENKGE